MTIGLTETQRPAVYSYFYQQSLITVDCFDLIDAEINLKTGPFALIIVNTLPLPHDSVQKLIAIVRMKSYTPVMALSSEENLLLIMRQGADICIPVHFDEDLILEYATKLMQRYTSYNTFEMDYSNAGIKYAQDLIINKRWRTLTIDHKEIHLTKTEYLLFIFLYHNRGIVLSHEEIKNVLWPGEEGYKRDVAKVISELRVKLGDDPSDPKYIRTIHGRGYLFLP